MTNILVSPPCEVRGDFDIFLALADKLGVKNEIYPGWTTTHDAFKEWQRVSMGRMCDYSQFTWEQIEANGGMQRGGKRLYEDGLFSAKTGKAILHPVPCRPFTEQPNEEFNFILNSGRTVVHWHTRTKTSQVKMLESTVPTAWLEMNPADAAKLRLKRTIACQWSRSAVNGAMGPFISDTFHLSPAQIGFMVLVPTLAGAFMRFPLGVLPQYIGRRSATIVEMSAIVIALLYGFFFIHTFNNVLAMGVLLGIAGASFGVALSLGSGWFPRQYKVLAMGSPVPVIAEPLSTRS